MKSDSTGLLFPRGTECREDPAGKLKDGHRYRGAWRRGAVRSATAPGGPLTRPDSPTPSGGNGSISLPLNRPVLRSTVSALKRITTQVGHRAMSEKCQQRRRHATECLKKPSQDAAGAGCKSPRFKEIPDYGNNSWISNLDSFTRVQEPGLDLPLGPLQSGVRTTSGLSAQPALGPFLWIVLTSPRPDAPRLA